MNITEELERLNAHKEQMVKNIETLKAKVSEANSTIKQLQRLHEKAAYILNGKEIEHADAAHT